MIKVIVDDAAVFGEELREEYDITVLNHPVYFGEEEVANLDYSVFCERMKKGEVSRTTLISPGVFKDIYERNRDNPIISVHLSSGLSGTIQSARIAAEETGRQDIQIVDSLMTLSGEALLAFLIAKRAKEGASFDELKKMATEIRDRIKLYFTIENLTYLERTGRLSKGKAMMGNLFRIKPVLTLDREGKIIPFDKARTNVQVINKILDEGKRYEYIFINRSCYSDLKDSTVTMLKEKCEHLYIAGMNNTCLTYTGPRAWTIAMY
ncbi:MAG: DegV family EDD domain-containing protein [Proteobacteria bacterium]|nr:DegV family EDD domain-containing protein [Pseudomonadota bacterium]